jgi:hypothetical protein
LRTGAFWRDNWLRKFSFRKRGIIALRTGAFGHENRFRIALRTGAFGHENRIRNKGISFKNAIGGGCVVY